MNQSKDAIRQLIDWVSKGIIKEIPPKRLEQQDLAGIDFSSIDVSSVCFDGSDLSYCTFTGSLLDCTFVNTVFHDTDMRSVFLHDNNLTKSQLSGIFFLNEDYEASFSKGDAS